MPEPTASHTSKKEEEDRRSDTSKNDEGVAGSGPTNHTITYAAPYYRYDEHLAFLGRSFNLRRLNNGYTADDVDDDLQRQIRRDSGVELVEDNVQCPPIGHDDVYGDDSDSDDD